MPPFLENLLSRLRNRIGRPADSNFSDASFLIANPDFTEAWLGSADQLTPERQVRIKGAAAAAAFITNSVNLQLGAVGVASVEQWQRHRPFVFGYVNGMAIKVGEAESDDSYEFGLFVSVSALCFLHGSQANGPALYEESRSFARAQSPEFLSGAAAAAKDFALPRGVIPTGLLAVVG